MEHMIDSDYERAMMTEENKNQISESDFDKLSFWVRSGWNDTDAAYEALILSKNMNQSYADRFIFHPGLNATSPYMEYNLQDGDECQFLLTAGTAPHPDRVAFAFNKAIRIRPSRWFYDEVTLDLITKSGNNSGLSIYNESNLPILNTNGRQRVGIGQSEYPSATLHVKKVVEIHLIQRLWFKYNLKIWNSNNSI